jgi:ATP-dependent Lon protease
VLPVGGVKEKVLAAHRAGLKTVILPRENARDLEEVPPAVRAALRFYLVSGMDQVLDLALERGKVRKGRTAAEAAPAEAELWTENSLPH